LQSTKMCELGKALILAASHDSPFETLFETFAFLNQACI
jgi:hypothetical protein